MGLGDCEQCWQGLCECGYQYRDWTKERRIAMAINVLGIQGKEAAVLVDHLEDDTSDTHPHKGTLC